MTVATLFDRKDKTGEDECTPLFINASTLVQPVASSR